MGRAGECGACPGLIRQRRRQRARRMPLASHEADPASGPGVYSLSPGTQLVGMQTNVHPAPGPPRSPSVGHAISLGLPAPLGRGLAPQCREALVEGLSVCVERSAAAHGLGITGFAVNADARQICALLALRIGSLRHPEPEQEMHSPVPGNDRAGSPRPVGEQRLPTSQARGVANCGLQPACGASLAVGRRKAGHGFASGADPCRS